MSIEYTYCSKLCFHKSEYLVKLCLNISVNEDFELHIQTRKGYTKHPYVFRSPDNKAVGSKCGNFHTII